MMGVPLSGRLGAWLPAALALLLAGWAQATAPIKGETDTRDYRHLRLDNGLQVLLISDPEADNAAVALDVKVGYYQDPPDREGLAHLLEQTLFPGQKEGPEGVDFPTFIHRHGGTYEAATHRRHTNFRFDLEPGHLAPALERFARLFVNPGFDSESVARERKAIQAEYEAQLSDDRRPAADVYRDLMHPDHPAAQFGVGTEATLADAESRPVYADLQAFFDTWHSADSMGLVVLGRAPLEDLQALVSEHFAALPTGGAPERSPHPPLFPEELLPLQVNIAAHQDTRRLSLLFPVPSEQSHYASKPLAYIADMLGYEGEGSLLALLKDLGWAKALSAGTRFSGDRNGIFEVAVDLTELGERATDQIMALVFYQLEHLRKEGVDEWRYAELGKMAALDFHYGAKPSPRDMASGLARRLHEYPPEDVLRGDYLYADYNADLIKGFLGHLRSDNVLVSLLSPAVSGDQMSSYYRASYRLTELDPEQPEIKSKVRKQLFFPGPNIFIPERVKLKEAPLLPTSSHRGDHPQRIVGRARSQVWFQRDHDFPVPKASLKLRLKLPLVAADLDGAAQAKLFAALVRDQLDEFVYPAKIAGLDFSLDAHARGLDISVYGYSSRQSLLLNKIVGAVRRGRFTQERFDDVKAQLMQEWRNESRDHPHQTLLQQIPRLHFSPYWSGADMSAALEEINLKALHQFADIMLQNAQIDALFYGNLYRQEAMRLAAVVEHQLSGDPSRRELMPARVYRLREGEGPQLYRHAVTDAKHLAVLYVQGLEASLADAAHMQLLRRMAGPAFSNELRTEQPSGNIVSVFALPLKTLEGSVFMAQSSATDGAELIARVEHFLNAYQDQIEQDMAGHQQALARALREPARNLRERAGRYWQSVLSEDHDFNRREQLAQAVEEVTAESLKHYFGAVMLAPERRLWLGKTSLEPPEGFEVTDSVGSYREDLEAIIYP